MIDITFITGNAKKAEELGRHLNHSVKHLKLDLPEIQSLDLSEIIKHKALEAFARVKKPVLVEDVSLKFSSLGNLPGPLIKWFLQEIGNDGLCNIIMSDENRSAVAEVQFGLALNENEVITFSGSMEGTISKVPKGEQGFGWDPIFIPQGHVKTWGKMSDEEKDQTSMRKIALTKLQTYLNNKIPA